MRFGVRSMTWSLLPAAWLAAGTAMAQPQNCFTDTRGQIVCLGGPPPADDRIELRTGQPPVETPRTPSGPLAPSREAPEPRPGLPTRFPQEEDRWGNPLFPYRNR